MRSARFPAVLFLLLCPAGLAAQELKPAAPIAVKVVVVAMFERGEDSGDVPGEYQYWVEREHLDEVLSLPAGYHHVRMNKDGVLGLLAGVGTAKATASVMALGLDPRFDLSKAYWLIAGIGGGDPSDVSLGSAIWVDHVVDGDVDDGTVGLRATQKLGPVRVGGTVVDEIRNGPSYTLIGAL